MADRTDPPGKPAQVINLRRARKTRARDAARREGDANAAAFGRTKAERRHSDAEKRLAERRLDAHRRDDDGKRENGDGEGDA